MGQLSIKGRENEIELLFDGCYSLDEALSLINKLTDEEKSFFSSSGMRVSYSGPELSYKEEMLFEKSIKSFFGSNASLVKKNLLSDEELEYSLDDNMTICTVIEKSLRSGEEVIARGDVLVFGDVNPGASITARGNITVLGALRGSAVTKEGRVYATYMQPSQIRIGKIYSYNKKSENVGAALALVQNGEIILQCL